jgi:hypothetical protein
VTQPFRAQFFISWSISMVSAPKACVWGLTESLERLKDLSQSAAMAGIARISNAKALSLGNVAL